MIAKILFVLFFLCAPFMAYAAAKPSDFCKCDQYLFKVSSVLFDYGQNVSKRVYGVGSLLKAGDGSERYFLLTVGHVASGLDLKVESSTGQSIPVVGVYRHPTEDLVVLEIDKKSARDRGDGLGIIHKDEIETVFLKSVLGSKEVPYWLDGGGFHQPTAAISLRSVVRDSLESVRFFLLLPAWLQVPQVNFDENLRKHNPKWDSTQEPLRIWKNTFQSFPQGFSGAPVLNSGYDKALSVHYRYKLLGILTTSQSDDAAGSSFLDASVITDFFQDILAWIPRGPSPYRTYWFLVDGVFVRSTYGAVDIFLMNGPVGNGVVVEGMGRNPDVMMNSEPRERIQHEGLAPADLSLVIHQTRKFKNLLRETNPAETGSSIRGSQSFEKFTLNVK